MRALRITLFASLILSVGAGHAYAQTEVAAYSLFGGTVTQAPDGNIFGVTVGAPILGEIFFPAYPPSPCFTATGCTLTDFTTTLTIGSVVYPDQASDGSPEESITFAFQILGIAYKYTPSPCVVGTADCPPTTTLTLSGSQFFTTDCQPDAVCGTLDFSGSQIAPTPEPSTIILMASGLLGLAFWARRGSRAAAAPTQTDPLSSPRPA
jgi:hypothetical protein